MNQTIVIAVLASTLFGCETCLHSAADCRPEESTSSGPSTSVYAETIYAVEPTPCTDRTDCRSDQECRGEVCVDHHQCDLSGAVYPCGWQWSRCTDQRAYEIACDLVDGVATCECEVNGIVEKTAEVSLEAEECHGLDHYMVNDLCGWRVGRGY